MVEWLEQQGYDVTYTDDVAVRLQPAALRNHKALVVSGHSEYWSLEEFNNFKAARDAGVNIASFCANTAYWKVRYEDSGRTAGLLQDGPGHAAPPARAARRSTATTGAPTAS